MEIKFRTIYSEYERTPQDLSRQTEDVYKYLEPFATDLQTGEILNKSSYPKLVKVGKLNIYNKIQEFRDSVDLYKILDKVLATGDASFLQRRVGSFADISNIPDNIHDFNSHFDSQVSELKKVSPEVGKMILDNSVSVDDINKLIQNEVKKQILSKDNNDMKGDNTNA